MHNSSTEHNSSNFSSQKLIKSRGQIKNTIPQKRTLKQPNCSNVTMYQLKQPNNNKNKYYNNLTKGERKVLKELADRNDITITKAHKGRA